jgi:hypothetical protein
MDNYFSTVSLFKALRDIRCGACGTTRKQGGIPSELVELKEHIKSIPWGELYTSEARGVLCLAWQDNNIVLVLSTIHSPYLYTLVERKKPSATSTNAAIARTPFGSGAESAGIWKKHLDIPVAINDYNHYMGGVDIANQYRSSYEIHLRAMRTWFPLFFFFLDAAIVNAYRIQYIAKEQQGQAKPSQLEFREKLYQELFQSASQAARPRPNQQTEARFHQRISLGRRFACAWCQFKREKGKRGQQAPRGTYGCRECGGIPLCLKGRCWDEFHSSD